MKLHQIPVFGRLFLPERNGTTPQRSTESERAILELGPLTPEAALAKLGGSERGLEPAQVEELRARYGLNEAVREKHLGFLGEIFERVKNPLVLQLLVIAIVSYLLDDLRATTVVGAMIVLSVFLSGR
jgi:P-type Mg2+ transporter